MEPAVRVELTTNGLQIRCSATELRWLEKEGRIMRISRVKSIRRIRNYFQLLETGFQCPGGFG